MAAFGVRQPRVIYFTAGMVPTDAEVAEIHQCGNNVVVRNASKVDANLTPGQIEACEFVAGAIPHQYAAKFQAVPHITPRPLPVPAPAAPVGKKVKAPAPETVTDPATSDATPAAALPAWKPNT